MIATLAIQLTGHTIMLSLQTVFSCRIFIRILWLRNTLTKLIFKISMKILKRLKWRNKISVQKCFRHYGMQQDASCFLPLNVWGQEVAAGGLLYLLELGFSISVDIQPFPVYINLGLRIEFLLRKGSNHEILTIQHCWYTYNMYNIKNKCFYFLHYIEINIIFENTNVY